MRLVKLEQLHLFDNGHVKSANLLFINPEYVIEVVPYPTGDVNNFPVTELRVDVRSTMSRVFVKGDVEEIGERIRG